MKNKLFYLFCASIIAAGCEDTENLILNYNEKETAENINNAHITDDTDEKSSGDIQEPGSGDIQEPGSGDIQEPGSGDIQEPGSGDIQEPGSGIETDPSLDPSIPRDVVGGLLSKIEDWTCEPPETMCYDQYYVECQNNHYYIKNDCENDICIDGIGCGICVPDTKVCESNNVMLCAGSGQSYSIEKQCKTMCYDGDCLDDQCPEDATYIYLVDSNYHLVKFNPGAEDGSYLTELFTLNCGNGLSTPFSMAVDRDANAWVLYSDSTLYKINIANPTCQKITKFTTNGSGLSTFGMAFSLDTVGGTSDTLYIAESKSNGSFGIIDTHNNMSYHPFGNFPSFYDQTPELTGTALAELYSFSPGEHEQHISKIDKSTGDVIIDYKIPGAGSFINAWAFAHWGGDYFIFETLNSTNNNRILRFSPKTKETSVFLENTPYRVVGAGVSTCAPTVPPKIN